jgi:hypothetical protein
MGRGHLIDLGVDGRIVLDWIFKKLGERLGWMGLARGRDSWWPIMKAK